MARISEKIKTIKGSYRFDFYKKFILKGFNENEMIKKIIPTEKGFFVVACIIQGAKCFQNVYFYDSFFQKERMILCYTIYVGGRDAGKTIGCVAYMHDLDLLLYAQISDDGIEVMQLAVTTGVISRFIHDDIPVTTLTDMMYVHEKIVLLDYANNVIWVFHKNGTLIKKCEEIMQFPFQLTAYVYPYVVLTAYHKEKTDFIRSTLFNLETYSREKVLPCSEKRNLFFVSVDTVNQEYWLLDRYGISKYDQHFNFLFSFTQLDRIIPDFKEKNYSVLCMNNQLVLFSKTLGNELYFFHV